ncbi:thioesterase II family protein [Azorhizophilus paspali]|uniref:thioesterase II family protein n=1 Tax=Azorhizophilus paspali TaxID=69963 RepID=UPI00363297E0
MTNIFCFPHAGGSASNYKIFSKAFPEEVGRVIPIEIPGRGRRSTEPFADTLEDCVLSSLDQIDTDAGEYYLHGHCMGALLAFEAVKYLESHGRRKPRLLIVSGRNAACYQTDWGLRVAGLDDQSLFDELSKVGECRAA